MTGKLPLCWSSVKQQELLRSFSLRCILLYSLCTADIQILSLQVPRLHKILAAELAAIQGSAAANQRALIQSEIEAILVYAVQWNAVQEGSAARRELLDAWRQVTETLITVTPAELLPSAGKQQVLLQMLQSLLNKVACEAAVPGLDTLVSSTVLLLLTSLRSTYSAMPERREVMGETFVGLLDAAAGETNTSQTYSASLQVTVFIIFLRHFSFSLSGCSAWLVELDVDLWGWEPDHQNQPVCRSACISQNRKDRLGEQRWSRGRPRLV